MQSYHKIVLISHAIKVMLKILQARLQQYVNRELADVQATFRKGRETRDQIANINWMGIPDHLIFLPRNLHAGQEATIRTGHGTTDWFQLGKENVKTVYCHPDHLTYM